MEIAENEPTILTTREEICAAVKELKRKKCKDKTGWNNELVLARNRGRHDRRTTSYDEQNGERKNNSKTMV